MRSPPRKKKRGLRVRRRTEPLVFTPKPLRAVLLAIDAAKCSGLATYVDGRLHGYAEADAYDPAVRFKALRDAQTTALLYALPLGIVCETPYGGHLTAVTRLTAVVTLWRDTWYQLGGRKSAFLEYTAADWRRALFGRRKLVRAAARALEMRVALQQAGRDLPRRTHRIGHDAAAAICFGQVMIRASAVQEAIGCRCG